MYSTVQYSKWDAFTTSAAHFSVIMKYEFMKYDFECAIDITITIDITIASIRALQKIASSTRTYNVRVHSIDCGARTIAPTSAARLSGVAARPSGPPLCFAGAHGMARGDGDIHYNTA